MGLTQFEEHSAYIDLELIDNAQGTGNLNIYRAAIPGRIDSLILASDDTVDHVLQLWAVQSGTPTALLGSVSVPAGSGTDGVLPSVDAIPLVFPTVLTFYFDNTYQLGVRVTVAVTAGKNLWVAAIGGYFY